MTFSDESGRLRVSVKRDGFFPDGPRDNELRRVQRATSAMGRNLARFVISTE